MFSDVKSLDESKNEGKMKVKPKKHGEIARHKNKKANIRKKF